MRWSLTIAAPPEADALDVETDLRTHLRVDGAGQDDEIRNYLGAAVEWFEGIGSRCLITTEYLLTVDSFPGERLDRRCGPAWDGPDRLALFIPRNPVQTIDSVKYDDVDGVERTLSPSAYRLDSSSGVARLTPAYGTTWPCTRDQTGAVRVAFTAGDGDAETDVPKAVKQLIRLLVGLMFKHREPVVTGTIVAELPWHLRPMLARVKRQFPTFPTASAA